MIFWGGEVENSATHLVKLKMDGFIYSCTNMNNFWLLLSVVYFYIGLCVFYTDLKVTALLVFTLVMYNTQCQSSEEWGGGGLSCCTTALPVGCPEQKVSEAGGGEEYLVGCIKQRTFLIKKMCSFEGRNHLQKKANTYYIIITKPYKPEIQITCRKAAASLSSCFIFSALHMFCIHLGILKKIQWIVCGRWAVKECSACCSGFAFPKKTQRSCPLRRV